ncbi:Hypothetical protein R9X50_00722800 [Acrodontium crateriforme]|uniref:Uncharacterized protein n=1 Tax=Acrodontium crateriforme TaxID=150365 RepID=A0AAQ3M9U3_9PEZI|nr:Hypothetical protein R9X50_00722800 [Acrodontium crateriforme]
MNVESSNSRNNSFFMAQTTKDQTTNETVSPPETTSDSNDPTVQRPNDIPVALKLNNNIPTTRKRRELVAIKQWVIAPASRMHYGEFRAELDRDNCEDAIGGEMMAGVEAEVEVGAEREVEGGADEEVDDGEDGGLWVERGHVRIFIWYQA